jgi:hypothetical protein
MKIVVTLALSVILTVAVAGLASANCGCNKCNSCNKCASTCCEKPKCNTCNKCENKCNSCNKCENKCNTCNKCESNCGRRCGCGGCRPECHWYPNLVERECCDTYLEMRDRGWMNM